MKRHTFNLEDLQGFESKTTLASSVGNGSSKSLILQSEIDNYNEVVSFFIVNIDDVQILRTESLSDAIQEYNKY